MNQSILNEYFSTAWKSELDVYQYSGWQLVDKVKTGEHVIDVGCGFNEFKSHIPNLIGIDPANPVADILTTIEEFNGNSYKFDVAFCLGSINFGSEDTILEQIRCVVDLLKPKSRIYWRCNPGLYDHNNEECNVIEFYPWTEQKLINHASLFGYSVKELQIDSKSRLYAEWVRN